MACVCDRFLSQFCDTSCCANERGEQDPQMILRQYARNYLGAPESEYDRPPKGLPELTPNEFQSVFRTCLRTRGWEVWKYGRFKKVSRKLMVSTDGLLTWGSRKEGDDIRKSIPIKDIETVVRQPADDAPPNADRDAMLCIIVKDGTALKILCNSVTDALVLAEGFKQLYYHYGGAF
mmetsp:Transcript_3533/g.11602  ORF Transcript_3533/g.11602 Transcript_3533/m.11602 type:complete len:177 (-) Transcript_3533:150-680(-)